MEEPSSGLKRLAHWWRGLPSWQQAVLVTGVMVALLYAAGGSLSDVLESSSPRSTPDSDATTPARSIVVEYMVSGSASSASLTYENDTGGINQTTVSLPWRREFDGFARSDFLYISAQNASRGRGETGTLECTIRVDGQVKFSGSASGASAICTASGSLDR